MLYNRRGRYRVNSGTSMSKVKALADFLNLPIDNIRGGPKVFKAFDSIYAVMTPDEASTEVREVFPEKVLSLPQGILIEHSDSGVTKDTIDELFKIDGIGGMLCLIKDLDALREDALELYGRGYFLASDFEEHEHLGYAIYHLN